MKKYLSTIFLLLVFLTGLSLLLYPTASDYWNSLHQSKTIAEYAAAAAKLDSAAYEGLMADAQKYNEALLTKQNRFYLSAEERAASPTLRRSLPSTGCFRRTSWRWSRGWLGRSRSTQGMSAIASTSTSLLT